jgi:hypothetical protein
MFLPSTKKCSNVAKFWCLEMTATNRNYVEECIKSIYSSENAHSFLSLNIRGSLDSRYRTGCGRAPTAGCCEEEIYCLIPQEAWNILLILMIVKFLVRKLSLSLSEQLAFQHLSVDRPAFTSLLFFFRCFFLSFFFFFFYRAALTLKANGQASWLPGTPPSLREPWSYLFCIIS